MDIENALTAIVQVSVPLTVGSWLNLNLHLVKIQANTPRSQRPQYNTIDNGKQTVNSYITNLLE